MAESRTLELVLRLKDEVSKQLGGFNNQLKSLEPEFRKIRNTGLAAFAGVSGAILLSTKESIANQAATTRLTHILQTATGATDAQVKSLLNQAEALEQIGVVSKQGVITAQSQLATFDLQAETIERLTPAILDYVVAEKGASASTEDLKQMTNGLAQALQGNFASLTRTGFVLDEATKELIKNGTEAERSAALVDVLNSTYKDFNATARDTAEGSLVVMKNEFNNLREAVGDAFLPVLVDLVDRIAPVIRAAKEWAEANPELIRTIAAVALGLSSTLVVIGTLGMALPALASGFSFLISPLGLITGAALLLTGWFIKTAMATGNLDDYIKRATDTAKKMWEGIKDLNDRFQITDKIIAFVVTTIKLLKSAWDTISDAINRHVLPAIKRLLDAFDANRKEIGILATILKGVLFVAFTIVMHIVERLIRVFGFLVDAISTVISFVGAMVKTMEAAGRAIGWVADKITGFLGISRQATGVVQSFSSAANESFMSVAETAGGMSNPLMSYATELDFAKGKTQDFGSGSVEAFDKAGGGASKATDEVKKLAEEYDKVLLKIADLNKELEKLTIEQVNKERGYREQFAEAFVKQEEKVAGIKEQLETRKAEFAREASRSESIDRINNLKSQVQALQESYNQELNALNQRRSIAIAYEQEIDNVRSWNALTDFERTVKTIELKAIEERQALNAQIANINTQIIEEERKAKEIIASQVKVKDSAIESSNAATDVVVTNYKKMAAEAEESARRQRAAMQSVSGFGGGFSSAVMSVAPRMSVQDAIITPQGKVIQTDPADYLIATKRPQDLSGSGVNINITVNGDVSGQELVDKVKDGIMQSLRFNSRMAI